jgi:hypothetical protein
MVRRLLASESRTSRIFALLNWFGLFADSEMEPRLVEVVDEIFDLNIATTEVRQRIVQLATSFFVKNHHEKDRVPEDIYIRFFEKLRGYLITLDFDTMIPTEKDKFLHIVNIFCKKMSRSNSQSEHLRDLAEKILSVL